MEFALQLSSMVWTPSGIALHIDGELLRDQHVVWGGGEGEQESVQGWGGAAGQYNASTLSASISSDEGEDGLLDEGKDGTRHIPAEGKVKNLQVGQLVGCVPPSLCLHPSITCRLASSSGPLHAPWRSLAAIRSCASPLSLLPAG